MAAAGGAFLMAVPRVAANVCFWCAPLPIQANLGYCLAHARPACISTGILQVFSPICSTSCCRSTHNMHSSQIRLWHCRGCTTHVMLSCALQVCAAIAAAVGPRSCQPRAVGGTRQGGSRHQGAHAASWGRHDWLPAPGPATQLLQACVCKLRWREQAAAAAAVAAHGPVRKGPVGQV